MRDVIDVNEESLLWGFGAQYAAGLFNNPKFPPTLKVIVLILVCVGIAWYQNGMLWPPTRHSILEVMFGAAVAWGMGVKYLGAGFIEKTITKDNLTLWLRKVLVTTPDPDKVPTPAQIEGGRNYTIEEVNALLAQARGVQNPNDNHAPPRQGDPE